MLDELLLAGFIMAVGVAIAGSGTYLYQLLVRQPAALRYDGPTLIHSFGNLAVSFVCGPYILLQMGWQQERNGALSVSSALVAAFVAFGWAFITGLIAVGAYVSAIP